MNSNDLLKMPLEFAVGIEDTFIPQERLDSNPPLRALDQYQLMRHYEQWQADLDLVASLKTFDKRVTKLRWGLPWYRIETAPGCYDWSWSDRVVDYANKLKIDLVVDIVHYGTPLWLRDSFINPRYPERVARFAGAVAARYLGRIKCYTALNEPCVNAHFSGRLGQWPPYLCSPRGYVSILMQLASGMQKTVQALRAVDPGATIFAVEAVCHYRPLNAGAAQAASSAVHSDLVCWDLVHGKVNARHSCYAWLRDGGATAAQFKQLSTNAVKMDVLGVNFYPWSCKTKELKDGQIVDGSGPGEGTLLASLLEECYKYTRAPLFVTETSAHGGGGSCSSAVIGKYPDMRVQWLDQTIDAVANARQKGIPVLGYTQFPLFTMVDWLYRVHQGPSENYFLNLGMFEVMRADGELKRVGTRVVDRFLYHLQNFEC